LEAVATHCGLLLQATVRCLQQCHGNLAACLQALHLLLLVVALQQATALKRPQACTAAAAAAGFA
jgi:hypothetical protein